MSSKRAFPNAVAIDPNDCGCIECLIGFYVNETNWCNRATAHDLLAFYKNKVRNHTGSSFGEIFFNSEYSEDSAQRFIKLIKEEMQDITNGKVTLKQLANKALTQVEDENSRDY